MEVPQKRKIMAKVEYPRPTSRNANVSRPASPTKYLAQPPPSPGPSNLLRPKAKVNSSAAVRARKMSSTASSVISTTRVNSAPPRASSPFKPSQAYNGTTSPPTRPPARVTVRPPSKSVAASPDASADTSRAAAAVTRLEAGSPPARRRHGSMSLHHSPSSSALGPTSPASPFESSSMAETLDSLLVSNVRVRSKVSETLKASLQSTPSLATSPPYATTRPIRPRSRPPSISSMGLDSFSPPTSHSPFIVYPITTCIPSANPHRYSPPRPPPPLSIHTGARLDGGKVDLEANIALPHSPPTSTLSFSSKSSTSRSSASQHTRNTSNTLPTSVPRINGLGFVEGDRDGVPVTSAPPSREPSYEDDVNGDDSSIEGDDYDTEHDSSDDPDRKFKAEAKSIRKIADLEITNRSLMSINSTLEATKNKQAKEIRELRRKLRESMLILPPRTFQAVKSNFAENLDQAADKADIEEEDEEEEEDEGDEDPAFNRVKSIIESLLEVGKRALETKPEDFAERSRGGTKVLTAEEVQSWRDRTKEGDSGAPNGQDDHLDTEAETSFGSSVSPSHLTIPLADDGITSEEEVEALMSEPVVITPAPIPPITISTS